MGGPYRLPDASLRRRVPAAAFAAAVLVGAAAPAGEPAPRDNPLLLSSTFLGGSAVERASVAAFGPDGALWVAAATRSLDIPGAERTSAEPTWTDTVVLRIDPVSRGVLSAAWLTGLPRTGTAGSDVPVAFAFDDHGHAYVAGTTTRRDFDGVWQSPTTEIDAFVARVRDDGADFEWVFRLGAGGDDHATGLCVAPDGDPVVTGTTNSSSFPEVSGVPAPGHSFPEIFVSRIRADGTGLVFSTYLGGQGSDSGGAIANAPGGGFLVGATGQSREIGKGRDIFGSPDNALHEQAYLLELGDSGSKIVRAARLGTTVVTSIAAAADGSIVLAGVTSEPVLPIPLAPHGPPGAPGGADAFLVRLDATDWSVLGGGVYGGSQTEWGVRCAPGPDGRFWLTGTTLSDDLPAPGGVRLSRSDFEDTFVATFDGVALTNTFATYLGGSARESEPAIAPVADGTAWAVGSTDSNDFPVLDPVQVRVGVNQPDDLHLTHLAAGDPSLRPAAPLALTGVPVSGTLVRLTWQDPDGRASGFLIERAATGKFRRVTIVPGGSTSWDDADVVPDHGYSYRLQALNAAGGSGATGVVRVVTPATLGVTTRDARLRQQTGRLRLAASVAPAADGAPAVDPRANGFSLLVFDAVGPHTAFDIAPGDTRWHATRRRLTWRSHGITLTFDPRKGAFDARLRTFPLSVRSGDALTFQVVSGTDAGSATNPWRRSPNGVLRAP